MLTKGISLKETEHLFDKKECKYCEILLQFTNDCFLF